jgi:hypothetical protein
MPFVTHRTNKHIFNQERISPIKKHAHTVNRPCLITQKQIYILQPILILNHHYEQG